MSFSIAPAFVIDVSRIRGLLQEKKLKFKPSAAAIHPLTAELYIHSSVNKMLVIVKDGIPEKAFRINSALCKQPEGLAFMPDGNLIISNESANAGAPDILICKYNLGQ
jgi:hypothetical protein